MNMPKVSLVDVASYLPGDPVPTEYFTQFSRSERMAKNVMFRSPTGRHHISRDETAVDMAEKAFAPLRELDNGDRLGEHDSNFAHRARFDAQRAQLLEIVGLRALGPIDAQTHRRLFVAGGKDRRAGGGRKIHARV